MRDYYKVLGVSETATSSKIKEAYRKLVLQYHPDKNPGDQVATEMLKMINEAYGTLSDPHKKRLYDGPRHPRTAPGSVAEHQNVSTQDNSKFDWVGFTCHFLRNIFIGLLIFIGTNFYFNIYYRKTKDESLLQWLFIFLLPFITASHRGFNPLDVHIASSEIEDGMNWLTFIMHFVFGVLVGLAYCFFLRIGIYDDLYPKTMAVLFLAGIPLLLGIVGGIYQNQLWEPLLKRWFTRPWGYYS